MNRVFAAGFSLVLFQHVFFVGWCGGMRIALVLDLTARVFRILIPLSFGSVCVGVVPFRCLLGDFVGLACGMPS